MDQKITVRQRAREQLLKGGNLARLAILTVLGLVAMMLPFLLFGGMLEWLMLSEATAILGIFLAIPLLLLWLASVIFFSLPVWHAGYRMAYAICEGDTPTVWWALRSVFGKGYANVLIWSIFAFLRFLLLAAVVVGGVMLAVEAIIFSMSGIFGAIFYLVLTAIALVALLFVLRRGYFVQAGLCQGMKWKEANRYSKCLMAQKRGDVLRHSLYFAPWLLLSLPTVGVLFVVYTMPYIFLSYAYYSEESASIITKQDEKGNDSYEA